MRDIASEEERASLREEWESGYVANYKAGRAVICPLIGPS